jgi:hypothetical protein
MRSAASGLGDVGARSLNYDASQADAQKLLLYIHTNPPD